MNGLGNTRVNPGPNLGQLTTLLDGTYVGLSGGPFGNLLAAGEEAGIGRDQPTSSVTLSSGTLRLAYWTARRTETCTKIYSASGATAAAATPTLCRMGVYSVAGNGNLTLVAACANDTTLWASTSSGYERALTSSFEKVAGQRYALGLLCVTAAAAPVVLGLSAGNAVSLSQAPRRVGAIGGQADLPASINAGSVGDTSLIPYGEVRP